MGKEAYVTFRIIAFDQKLISTFCSWNCNEGNRLQKLFISHCMGIDQKIDLIDANRTFYLDRVTETAIISIHETMLSY